MIFQRDEDVLPPRARYLPLRGPYSAVDDMRRDLGEEVRLHLRAVGRGIQQQQAFPVEGRLWPVRSRSAFSAERMPTFFTAFLVEGPGEDARERMHFGRTVYSPDAAVGQSVRINVGSYSRRCAGNRNRRNRDPPWPMARPNCSAVWRQERRLVLGNAAQGRRAHARQLQGRQDGAHVAERFVKRAGLDEGRVLCRWAGMGIKASVVYLVADDVGVSRPSRRLPGWRQVSWKKASSVRL